MEYIAYLHKDKSSDYGVSFPDFPGCVTAGSSLDEARAMAAEALAVHIAGMREDREEVPDPSTLDKLRDDPAMKGAIAFLVSPTPSERVVRVNITIPESQLKQIDDMAEQAGLSRSAFLVQRALESAKTAGAIRRGRYRLGSSVKPRTRDGMIQLPPDQVAQFRKVQPAIASVAERLRSQLDNEIARLEEIAKTGTSK